MALLFLCIFRRMNCGYDTSAIVQILEDQQEDSEVRIAAFLGLMRCPTYGTIRLVKNILETEQVNQGKFPRNICGYHAVYYF